MKIKLESVESLLLSKFSVFCGLFENRDFCWMKYRIIKIPYVSYMHPQFSEARKLVLPMRTDATLKYL